MARMDDRGGPLAGIRVIELGTMIAGPVAATLLGDFGAEVIKIEPPKTGDPIRHSGPFVGEESLYWNVEGRSKRSVTIDLRKPEGQALLRRLAEHADVLIENFRPGTMKGWGIDYDVLRTVNPRLVMLSISGFGQTGPNAARPAYDRISLAYAGFLNMTGYPDRAPVRPGTAMADYQSALFGAYAIMIALYSRDARGGAGQQIDLSLFEAVFRFTDVMITAYDKLGMDRERRGNKHFAASPGDHYKSADDRYIALTIAANNVFLRLCAAIGRPDLAVDPRFESHIRRVEHYDAINDIVADWIKARPAAEAMAAFEANGVPHSLIYSPADILNDPHYAARGAIATIAHPTIGALKLPAIQPHFSTGPAPEMRPAPALGEDTDTVLTELLALSPESLAELRASGVV
ncbi:CaiB/BaiF CoA-transferase family protein [Sphingomonas sp. 1P06PA]|uniref:CaiB/BaiF CoA transferase family protein n=1 Tax=Sphingomonas sp. 1P06PA TaxID=554121 RepID=UPI0039A68C0D